ncbi:MAG TPA: hypothetical protein DCP53_04375 [Elusimicrobia bacterium]|nr:MAG: hypothetical protein A2551_04560 [Elusimicrobia bacterium RIFOXYD2_FULL_34_30]HAM38617.1 hypothetical protein [Elusimicrobiota bacterium]
MTVIYQIIFALIIGIIVTIMFNTGCKRTWLSIFVFFGFVFLAAWAASLWIIPTGPLFLGIYWLPLLIVGLIFGLLLALLIPLAPPQCERKQITENEDEVKIEKTQGIFFWIAIAVLIVIIVLGYL